MLVNLCYTHELYLEVGEKQRRNQKPVAVTVEVVVVVVTDQVILLTSHQNTERFGMGSQ